MSQDMEAMVKKYLKNVKEKLPEWLKDKKKEVKDILAELEGHIWEKAEELSDINQPTEDSVRLAIAHMGTPESIAREYKRRGTPKYYITEELWPLYTKILKIILVVIIAIAIFSTVLNVMTGNLEEALSFFGYFNYFMGFFSAFTIVSIIFVVLSMEGYFPEDFKSERELKKEARRLEIAREKGLPIAPRTGKPLKPFISPIGEIIGGIIVVSIGIFLITLPIPGLFNLMNPEFLLILRIFGMFTLIEGVLDTTRGVIGNYQVKTHQVIHIITIGVKLAVVPLAVILWSRPDIIPFLNWDDSTNTLIYIGVSPEFYDFCRNIMAVIIVITILVPIEDIYKIIKLEKYKVKN
ncbi:MAG: hypothetical protein KAX10_05120 [Candidatus Lokiarchaeota archaeon]|nr:hypothetical protein [Candidatus Lokiarchaeota archaeon]